MFSSLMKWIKKILKWLIPLLVIIFIVIAVFFPAFIPVIMGWLSTAFTTVGGWLSTAWSALGSLASSAWGSVSSWVATASIGDVLKMAAGIAIIADPEGSAAAVGTLIGATGDLVSDVVGAIPSSVWLMGAGILAFWLFNSSRGGQGSVVVVPASNKEKGESEGLLDSQRDPLATRGLGANYV